MPCICLDTLFEVMEVFVEPLPEAGPEEAMHHFGHVLGTVLGVLCAAAFSTAFFALGELERKAMKRRFIVEEEHRSSWDWVHMRPAGPRRSRSSWDWEHHRPADTHRSRSPRRSPRLSRCVVTVPKEKKKDHTECPEIDSSRDVVDGGGECTVCMDQRATAVFTPCGHMCCCFTCAHRCANDGGCPICRGEVDNVVRVYAS